MDFGEFIAPMPVETFLSGYWGKRPAHVEGRSQRADLLPAVRIEQLLAVRPHWTDANLKLILNSRPVMGQHFLDPDGRADPAKVQLFLGMGASLVGDHVEDIDAGVRHVASMLSKQFAGTSGANLYYSFKGIRAFNSHCDLHEVFAIQLQGEKIWRIYENRAEAPVETLQGEDAQSVIDRAKGKVMMTAHMRPGAILYIPRGYFHDALAQSDESVHLTFGIRPLDGRYIFRLLEQLAVRNSKFREYLPDARDDPQALRAHLAELSGEVAAILQSPLFETLLVNRQRSLVEREATINLQDRPKLEYYAATGASSEVAWGLGGATLRHGRGEEPLGALAEAAEWALGQAAFSRQQLSAQFGWLSSEEIGEIIDLLTRTGLIASYQPAL